MAESVLESGPMTERQKRIVNLISSEGFVSVRNLKEHLTVSEMTVRRDLRVLAELDLVRLVHGGAALTHGTLRTPGFVNRAGVESDAKRRIADAAREYVRAGDAIVLDAGTTTYALAERMHDANPNIIITNSIPVLQLYLGRPSQRVVGLGGDVIIASQAMAGSLAVSAVDELRATTMFLGGAAVDSRGIYVETDIERPTKLAMMAAADDVILLCDASKFTVSAPVRLSSFEGVDVLISDAEPPPAIRRAADKAGMRIQVAD